MRAEELDDSLLVLQARHEHVEVHPVDPLDRELHMTADDLGNVLCYHPLGSGRAGFASRRHLGRSSVLETGLTRPRHQPAIGATKSTRLVGLRRSLARISMQPRSTISYSAITEAHNDWPWLPSLRGGCVVVVALDGLTTVSCGLLRFFIRTISSRE